MTVETIIAGAAAQGLSKTFDTYLSITILVLGCMALGYGLLSCRKDHAETRKKSEELADKYTVALVESAKSSSDLASAVRELKEVVRSK